MTAVCNKRPLNSPEEQARIRENFNQARASFALEGMNPPEYSHLLEDAIVEGRLSSSEAEALLFQMVKIPRDQWATYIQNAVQ